MPGIGATGERTDDARRKPLPAWGEKESGVVRKWYARFLMRLEARGLEAYRINRANPSLGGMKSGLYCLASGKKLVLNGLLE